MNPVVKVLFKCVIRFSIFVGTHLGIFVRKFLVYLRAVFAFPQKLARPLQIARTDVIFFMLFPASQRQVQNEYVS